MFRKMVVLAAMPLLIATACANEADQGAVEVRTGAAAVSALRAAPDAVAEAGTSQFEMVMEMAMGDRSFEIVASGATDEAARQMSMSMDMGSMFNLFATEGEEVPDGFGEGTLEMVIDGDTVYFRSPLFDMLTGTSGWLSASMEELGGDTSELAMGTSDPSAVLEGLRGIGGEPQAVGQEEIRGVPTTHYEASMSLADALEDVPESERADVEAALEQLGDLDGAEIPVDVWIDEDGLPRRMQMDMGAAFGALAGEDATVTMTIDVFGYGEPVDIEIPAADEVTPISETLGGLEGFLGS